MSCIKTGAHIFLRPYNSFAHCDAFEYNDILLFRIVAVDAAPFSPVLHYTINDWYNWFDQQRTAPTTPSTLIVPLSRATYHGYDGTLISELNL